MEKRGAIGIRRDCGVALGILVSPFLGSARACPSAWCQDE